MSGIYVQIDISTETDAETIWSGTWPHVPAQGDTFEIRSDSGTTFYQAINTHWIMYDDVPAVNSAIVTAEEWDPGSASTGGETTDVEM